MPEEQELKEKMNPEGAPNTDPEATEGDIRVVDGNQNRGKIVKVLVLGLVLVLVLGGVVLGLLLGLDASGSGSVDCSSDDFQGILVPGGKRDQFLKVSFKYKAIRVMFTYEEAKAKCEELGSELWQVQSENEWDAVTSKIDDLFGNARNGFWLDGQPEENCEVGAAAVCKHDEAARGKGLKVRWRESGKISSYSRLTGGPDESCIYVKAHDNNQENEDRIWKKASCESKYFAACVKRDCKAEPVAEDDPTYDESG